MPRTGHAVYIGILHEETVAVPQRQDNALDCVAHPLVGIADFVSLYHGGVHEEEAQGIRTKLADCLHRVSIIAQALAHLASVLGKGNAAYNAVLERRLVKNLCGKHGQRIEPAARLVKPLADKIRREMLFKVFLVFKGIVVLRVGHGAAFKPTVKDFGNAVHRSAAFFTRNSNLVHKLLVQVFGIDAAELL